ncbi:hypothetical protein [Neorhizobium galegae]|uniref:hypothetical protein n=1 Tax=Neorhizobium galegae TaxID=399 RepID=UPI00069C6A39|nr:hypothetical protein [Neorhizobium galegae]MCQ1570259.1 hypothetical protein [Neorhizobium galegae]MCQ1810759.1 hypothetical protein [Neorhizobium galegae]MCQ1838046.1 hypothetical protein [Neorhizobium galegae]
MAQFITRVPHDIDIHHQSSAAFEEAVRRDTRNLHHQGFWIESRRPSDSELEMTFAHSDGAIRMNWVLELGLPPRLIDDAFIGMRASLTDVVHRKIEMYRVDRNPKHKSDLVDFLTNPSSIFFDFDLPAVENMLRELSLFRTKDLFLS